MAQTRAFSTLYLGTVALACLWAGRADLFNSLGRLPEVGSAHPERLCLPGCRVWAVMLPSTASIGWAPARARGWPANSA